MSGRQGAPFSIRPEQPADAPATRRVLEQAFPTTIEADLTDRLRADGAVVPELCLVVEAAEPSASARAGDVVGHVVLSRARLDTGAPLLLLGPLAVLPELQGRGVGGELVRAVLARAAETDAGLVVLLGHPAYYPRFGFESAAALGVRWNAEVPDDAWMAYRLPAYDPSARGTVLPAAAFDELG